MKQKWIDAYMDTAERFAQLSSAVRLKVGAVVVKDHRIISIGYNGMPAGWDNDCENTVFVLGKEALGTDMVALGYTQTNNGNWIKLKTKDEVLHAEENAILKLAKSHDGGDGASLFCTHAPCVQCAKLIYGAGINKVYYRKTYRDTKGVEFLEKCNIEVKQC
jgi:dCMP deaminase